MTLAIRRMSIPVYRNGEPVDSEADALWSLTWPGSDGRGQEQSIFSSWWKAIDELAHRWADGEFEDGAIVFAGELAVPWVLTDYLTAAAQASVGKREDVFRTYAKSAAKLAGNPDMKHRLGDPWIDDAAS